ncbi:MAG: cell division protein FtsQ/DivIB [Candidatus Dormibacteria bacterium]
MRAGLRLLVLFALLSVGVVLLSSEAFAARQVEISGTHHLTRAEVLRRTGLGRHGSIFLVTPEEAEASLMTDPYVRYAFVRTLLPGHVDISISEWEPLGLLHRDGRDYLLNPEGTVLGPGTAIVAGPAAGQPHVDLSWAATGPLRVGERALAGRLLQDLKSIQEAFPGVYHLTVQAITLSADQQLVITTREGPRILFGQMVTGEQLDSLDAKLASLKGLGSQTDLAHSRLDYINLMNPAQPVTRAIPSPSPSPTPSPSPSKR